MYKKIALEDIDYTDLPTPKGYKLLVAIPGVEEKTAGGIYRPDSNKHPEDVASITGLVVNMGQDAYKDERKFPTGPWAKVGDWVIMRSYSGARFKVHGVEYRLINDDTVEAVVPDPQKIARAGA